MAIVAALRELWRHRRLMLPGAMLALVAAVLISYQVSPGLPPQFENRRYEVGVASGAVLIDSQSSQTVDLGSSEGEVQVDVMALAARAKLLANLLVTRPLRDDIANMSGVEPDRLITELSSTTEPGVPPAPAADVTVQRDDPAANIISVQTSETVPILTVNAQAPTEETASRLAESTVTTLRSYLESVAADNSVPDVRKLVMRELGEPTAATSVRGPSKSKAAAIFVVLLALWCTALLGLAAVLRGWRQAVADEAWGHALAGEDARRELDLTLRPHLEDDPPRASLALGAGERPDYEPGLPPAPETASRLG